MRIAIDVSALAGTQGGMQIYLQQILKHLALLDRKNDYYLYIARWGDLEAARRSLPSIAAANFKPWLKRFPYKLLMNLENRLGLRVEERFLLPPIDLFHGACQMIPPLSRAKSVITVHHLEEARYNYPTQWDKFYYWDVYSKSVLRADQLIADSNYTKRYLLDTFKLDPEKINVVYHGIFDPKPRIDEEQKAKLRARFHLPERFIVCVSHMHLRKNTTRLVEAFARISSRQPDLHLVLVGGGHPDYIEEVRKKVRDCGLTERVHLTGPVSHEDVPAFYAAACLFVLPSLLEGFGIPLIEAMAMGCPIAASNATSIPEVVGDAGLLFNPEDVEEMSVKILQILDDSSLRNRLIEKGRSRAADFTWEKAARQTLDVYRKAVGA
jgi:alpha-1,3-rhamnosyl/mannosyltransferase